MKKLKKTLSVFLVLLLSLIAAFSSVACDLSDFKINLFGKSEQNTETQQEIDPVQDPENPSGEGEEGGDVNGNGDENGDGDETEDETPATLPDNVKFYPYIEDFDAAQSTRKLNVRSLEMLEAYIDYVVFYTVKTQVEITLTYASNFKTEYEKAEALYLASDRVSVGYVMSRSYSATRVGYCYLTESKWDNLAEKTFDEEGEYVLPQVDYALKLPEIEESDKREEGYDDFKLNSITKELNDVSNSEQLRWAIQNGYKPVCKEGSSAESMLNKAKAVLREIVSDKMDDLTKLRAIYEWLALTVQYDNLAAETFKTDQSLNATEYDAWYAEGVFNNYKAVCEGYAKAFIIMAGLEGIPAIFVSGDGHAWNRVILDGKWYVLDATHADVHVENNEIFTYSQFLITDADKTGRGYTATGYGDCAAVTEFNVFENIKFTIRTGSIVLEDKEIDLVVERRSELMEILSYAKNTVGAAKGSTVEVFVKAEDVNDFESSWMSVSTGYCESSYLKIPFSNGNACYTFYLK